MKTPAPANIDEMVAEATIVNVDVFVGESELSTADSSTAELVELATGSLTGISAHEILESTYQYH